MKKLLTLILIVVLVGCIQTEKEYYRGVAGWHFMTKKESEEFNRNVIYVTMDKRGYMMLKGAMNGNPISMNLDSLYMEMHNRRTGSYNIYDEQIAQK